MKCISAKKVFLKVVFIGFLLINFNASAQKTVIYIVRHAEKLAAPADDPALTATGQKRAGDLLKALKKENIAGIYVTKYKRTALTAQPLAQKLTLVPTVYDPADLKAFVASVFKSYGGHNILIVGHSNTILPTLAAFGSEQPFTALTDDDYDMLFKLTLYNGKAELEISYYGEQHHITQIPEQYLNYTTEHFVKPPNRF